MSPYSHFSLLIAPSLQSPRNELSTDGSFCMFEASPNLQKRSVALRKGHRQEAFLHTWHQ